MGTAKSPEPRRPAGIPRWLAVALSPLVWVAIPAVHAGLPWALSHLGPRYGWADGGPSDWNLLGYALVAVGAVVLAWIMVFGLSQYRNLPERVPIDYYNPAFLMTGGPYALSRHPMYVGELALWVGVAVVFGSPVALAGSAVMFAVMRRLVAREEAGLEAAFGDAYRRYKARVPRWVGLPRRAEPDAEPVNGLESQGPFLPR
ncbi:MAG TPA: isoprenylcysteine carboxylmethyltransferase family protein [Gemmataceae bacterium]|jgi:protein-S-isoprenylcysteine O-methyltransferase Ste14|nr:isoprenylcysteine carboxylmethyltransferase family protein [Gemmataceae bacterium]